MGSQSDTPEMLAVFMKCIEQPSCWLGGKAWLCLSLCRAGASRSPPAIPSLLGHTDFLLGSRKEIRPEVSGVTWECSSQPGLWDGNPALLPPGQLENSSLQVFLSVFVSCSSVFPV